MLAPLMGARGVWRGDHGAQALEQVSSAVSNVSFA